MNPRDLPEVVAELIIEMHEVRSELKAINGRLDRLEGTMEQVVREQRGMCQDTRYKICKRYPSKLVRLPSAPSNPSSTACSRPTTSCASTTAALYNLESPQQ